jgi:flavin reductase (DIM6/NTAB) family NADH-FMN oxidoreductase RutF
MTVDMALELRASFGCFATGVTIVTAPTGSGPPIGMTVSSFNSVSLEPPLVLFSIAHSARSLPELRKAPGFAVNVLAVDQVELSNRFARQADDKWAGVSYESGLHGAPLFDGAAGIFECEPHAIHEGGDHDIFVGLVVRHRSDPQAMPLIFHRGGYRELAAPDASE